jgi:hypothetical protein
MRPAMRHVIVSRFSVPRVEPDTAHCHLDPVWLARRLDLFRRHFAPSVGRLGVPTVLLCSSASASLIADGVADLEWASVEEQDHWHGGWRGAEDQMVTRLDSDDALHEDWFKALDAAPPGYEAYCTRRFLRLDIESNRLYAYKRREPSPLAAFPGGGNPFALDHAKLRRHLRLHWFRDAYLLQVVHGGNVSNRRPSWRRFLHQVGGQRLAPFGLAGQPSAAQARTGGRSRSC